MKENSENPNVYAYKVILLGDSFVGKTSLIVRFCDDTFDVNGLATIGIDSKKKFVKRKDKKVELEIWDTAGQERFRSLAKNCCNSMDGIILVFDLGNKDSFHHMKIWHQNLKDIIDFNKVGLVLVGNKCDIEKLEVGQNIIEDFCKKNNMKYIEASAKINKNVSEIFTSLIDVMFKIDEETNGFYKRTKSKVGKILSATTTEEERQRKKKCC